MLATEAPSASSSAASDDRGLARRLVDVLRAPLSAGGLVLAAGTFVILYPVIGVGLWVSILAALALYALEAVLDDASSRCALVGGRHVPEPTYHVPHGNGSGDHVEAGDITAHRTAV